MITPPAHPIPPAAGAYLPPGAYRRATNRYAAALLLIGILGFVVGLVLVLVALIISGNLPAQVLADFGSALYAAQASLVMLVVGAVLIATSILSFLLWLLAGALRS